MTGPLARRVRFVRTFRRLLAANHEALTDRVTAETGKTRWEAFTADLAVLLAACRHAERRLGPLLRPRRLTHGGLLALGQHHAVHRLPLGRVAIIATWNYPVLLLGIQLMHAIAAGNRVVVKPSENAPETQALLLDLARRAIGDAGLPPDTLAAVEPTREAGAELLRRRDDRPPFDHVVFTGSTPVGRAIAEVLAPTLTPSTLELSGRDSAFVLADADPRRAAELIWFTVTANGGQTCMTPRRALVHRAIYPEFLRRLALVAAAAGPRRLISADAARHAFALARGAVDAGGRSLSGVLEPPGAGRPDGDERWLRPLAVADCPEDHALVAGDHFAPVLAVVPVEDEAHALAVHNRCDQHLATSVFTKRPRAARDRLLPRLGVSTLTLNSVLLPTGHPAASIGGVRDSGWGRSQGDDGLLAMTRPVTASLTGRLATPPLDEPPSTRAASLARLVARFYGAAGAPEPPAIPPANRRPAPQPPITPSSPGQRPTEPAR